MGREGAFHAFNVSFKVMKRRGWERRKGEPGRGLGQRPPSPSPAERLSHPGSPALPRWVLSGWVTEIQARLLLLSFPDHPGARKLCWPQPWGAVGVLPACLLHLPAGASNSSQLDQSLPVLKGRSLGLCMGDFPVKSVVLEGWFPGGKLLSPGGLENILPHGGHWVGEAGQQGAGACPKGQRLLLSLFNPRFHSTSSPPESVAHYPNALLPTSPPSASGRR